MSQPPIDPTPEQPEAAQQPDASAAPAAQPEAAPFAENAPVGAPSEPATPQLPNYAPQPPHFSTPQPPAAPQFSAPQPPVPPAAPQYAAPQPPQAPQAPHADAPQPPAPQYAAPQAPAYGAPQPPQYAAPQPPQFGAPQPPQYGAPQYPAYGQPAAYPAGAVVFPPAPFGAIPGPGGPFDGATSPDDTSRPLYGATFGQASKRFFKNYAKFSGRASRSEYWWVALLLFFIELIPLVLYIPGIIIVASTSSSYGSYQSSSPNGFGLFLLFLSIGLGVLVWLAVIVPSLAITWRRLHDANFAGPLCLLALIPYVGWIPVLVFTLFPSKAEGRRFDALSR